MWLNFINFLTLFKIAKTILLKPALLKKMTTYGIWITNLDFNFINIGGNKISAYTILKTFLRQHGNKP